MNKSEITLYIVTPATSNEAWVQAKPAGTTIVLARLNSEGHMLDEHLTELFPELASLGLWDNTEGEAESRKHIPLSSFIALGFQAVEGDFPQ